MASGGFGERENGGRNAMTELNLELNELLSTLPGRRISAGKVSAVSSAIIAASREDLHRVAAAVERYVAHAPMHAKLAGIYAIDAACRRQGKAGDYIASALEPNIVDTVSYINGSTEIQQSTARVLTEWRKASLFASQADALYDLELRFSGKSSSSISDLRHTQTSSVMPPTSPRHTHSAERYDAVLRIPQSQPKREDHYGGWTGQQQQQYRQQPPPPPGNGGPSSRDHYYGPPPHDNQADRRYDPPSSYYEEENEVAAMPPYQSHAHRGNSNTWSSQHPTNTTTRGGPVQALLKTRMCRSVGTGLPCMYGDKCSFAHSEAELRRPEPRQHPRSDSQPQTQSDTNPKWQPHLRKTKLCKYFQSGHCPFGDKCNFAHGQNEVAKLSDHSASGGGYTNHQPSYYQQQQPATIHHQPPSHHFQQQQEPQANGSSINKRPPPHQRDLDEWSDTSLEPNDIAPHLLKRPRLAASS